MAAILGIQDVDKSFGGVKALSGVSFAVHPGEVHALVGENGAGKSSLIKILSGAHRPDCGVLTVMGQRVERYDPQLARALGIAVIYQQPALLPDLSVAENLAFSAELGHPLRRVDWAGRYRRAGALLERIGLAIDPSTPVRQLSMSEKQLVEIARALGGEARVLILDEPTAALSTLEVRRLLQIVGELRAGGLGIVYVSHRLEEVFEIADRVSVLRDGAVVAMRRTAELDRAELIRLMVGRELSTVFPKRAVAPGAALLEARGVGCSASGIEDASFTVHAGEIFGIFGLVSSGRTELARILFGITPADEGVLLLRGAPVRIGSPGEAVAHGIAYVPEDRRQHGVIPEMSVAANTTLSILRSLGRGGLIDRAREDQIAGTYVARFAVKTPSLATEVGTLSGGNQQKVALARWLATAPSVLILDEPTQGIDVGAKAEVHALMSDLAGRGLALIMISSELPEILGMSDRIAVMCEGRVAGILGRAEATPESLMSLALDASAGEVARAV
jgi:rhamnose transport system ATP-binding protein